MEQVEKTTEKVMDSLKQNQQKEQTGAPERCEKHGIDKVIYMGGQQICHECGDENRLIDDAHRVLNLPKRLRSCCFANYKPVDDSAKKIKESCEKYADDFTELSGGIIMIGGIGTGKTHLATSICKGVCDKGFNSKLTTIPRIIRKIRSSWNNNATDSYGQLMTEADVIKEYTTKYVLLVIDEIGSQYGSDSEKIIISEIINDRYNNQLPTVIIGNITMSDTVDYLGSRVVDRIKDDGRVLIFDWESHRKVAE